MVMVEVVLVSVYLFRITTSGREETASGRGGLGECW